MSTLDVTGRWIGRFFGTNVGNFVLDLQLSEGELQGQLRLNEVNVGLAVFACTGIVDGDGVALLLDPIPHPGNATMPRIQTIGGVDANGVLSGQWASEDGTAGGFSAVREDKLIEAAAAPPTPAAATAISYEKQIRAASCVVDIETLKRLYRALSTGADEAARLEHARLVRPPRPPLPELDDLAPVRQLYAVTLMARGSNGEQVLTLDPRVLEPGILPKPLRSIEFEIGLNYRLLTRGTEAPNRARVVLDFSRPPIFEFSNPSGQPTPNASVISVYGSDSIWVSGVYEKLTSTLREGRVRTGWLHSAYIYDALLFLVGFPLAFAGAATLTERIVPIPHDTPVSYRFVFLLFCILAALALFRLAFSFVRWLLPYVELASMPQPIHRRLRVLFATFVLGGLASLGASALWDALR